MFVSYVCEEEKGNVLCDVDKMPKGLLVHQWRVKDKKASESPMWFVVAMTAAERQTIEDSGGMQRFKRWTEARMREMVRRMQFPEQFSA